MASNVTTVSDVFTDETASAVSDLIDGEGAGADSGKLAFLYILYLTIGATGIISNAFVIFVIGRTQSMLKRYSNWFVAHLSVTDGIASLFVIVNTLKIQFRGTYHGFLGELRCHLITGEYMLFFLFTVSTYNLVIIAGERYLGVVYPIMHRNHFNRKKAILCLVAPWILGMLFNIPGIQMKVSNGKCSFVFLNSMLEQRALALWSFLGQFVVPVALMIYFYTRMGLVLAKANKVHVTEAASDNTKPDEKEARKLNKESIGPPKTHRNVLKTLVILCALFVLCGVQNHVAYFLYNMGYYRAVSWGSVYNHFTIVCINLNCSVNPFVYAFNYDQFKRGMRHIFVRGQRVTDRVQTITLSTVQSFVQTT